MNPFNIQNPFEHPDQPFDVGQFLENGAEQTEILFKDFFKKQVGDDINDSQYSGLKIYSIHRYVPINNIEIIQAYNNTQAAYLYLLYDAKCPSIYPFTTYLSYCVDLGPLTPYDVYLLTVHNIFDKDLLYCDYLVEHDQLIIIRP